MYMDPDLRLPASRIQTFKPSAEDERLVRDGVAYLVVRSPFFAHLLYHECRIAYTYEVPFAATDGKTLFFNPDGLRAAKLTVQEIAFIIAHEIAHCFFGDLYLAIKHRLDQFVMCRGGKLPYDGETMNIAQDYRINAMLIDGKIGDMPKDKDTGELIGLYDKNLSEKGMESHIDIYEKIFKRQGGGGGGGGGRPGGFDIHLEPSAELAKAIENGDHTQAIAAAIQAAEASGQGNLPECIKRMVGELLEPTVSWEDQLKATCLRAGGDPAYDWPRIDRRLIVRPNPMYFPPTTHTGAGLVIICVDTSGSIGQSTLDRFFAEMNGICQDLNPRELTVIWCDADIGRLDELDEPEDLMELYESVRTDGVNGGGGTSFRPPFEKIEAEGWQPDLVVYLTDAMGRFPEHEPDFPVVWAVIGGYTSNIPWGQTVEITNG